MTFKLIPELNNCTNLFLSLGCNYKFIIAFADDFLSMTIIYGQLKANEMSRFTHKIYQLNIQSFAKR